MPRWNGVQYNLKDKEPPFAYATFKNETWLFSLFEQPDSIPLYAAPVRTKDLTDDEIMKINVDTASIVPTCDRQFHFARAVIAAYKEKNK